MLRVVTTLGLRDNRTTLHGFRLAVLAIWTSDTPRSRQHERRAATRRRVRAGRGVDGGGEDRRGWGSSRKGGEQGRTRGRRRGEKGGEEKEELKKSEGVDE